MFITTHIAKENATESKIEMELLFLSNANKTTCLELIMSLDAEDRSAYLSQFMHKIAALQGDAEAAIEMEWMLAA